MKYTMLTSDRTVLLVTCVLSYLSTLSVPREFMIKSTCFLSNLHENIMLVDLDVTMQCNCIATLHEGDD